MANPAVDPERPRWIELAELMEELGEEMVESPREFLRIARRMKMVEENSTDALRIVLCAAEYFRNEEELWMEAYKLSGDEAVLERAITLNLESKLFPIVRFVADHKHGQNLWIVIDNMIDNWKAQGSPDGWEAWISSAIFLSEEGLRASCQYIIWKTGTWPIMPVKLRNRGYYLTEQDMPLPRGNIVPEEIDDDVKIESSESSEEAVNEDNENRA